MIFNLIKLAIDIGESEEKENVISLIQDETIEGFVEIEVFVKDNFSDFIYNFYNLYIKMDPLAVFTSLDLSKFNFKKEILNKDSSEVRNILEKANEIRAFLHYLENYTLSDFIKKVATEKILKKIKEQFQKISESAKANFELYSEEIKKEVEEIINTCLIVISKKGNKNLSDLSEEILWETHVDKFIDDKNIADQLDFNEDKETINQIKNVFKNNLANLISDYVNDDSKLKHHIESFNSFFKSDYFINSIAALSYEDFIKFVNLNSYFNYFILSNNISNKQDQMKAGSMFRDENFKIVKFLSKEALSKDIFKVSNTEIKSAAKMLLKKAKFIFTTDHKKDSDLEKAFGIYGIDKFEYDIKNLIILNLKNIIKKENNSSEIKKSKFFAKIQETTYHEFEHYLDFALPRFFLLKKINTIKSNLREQFLRYQNNQVGLVDFLKINNKFISPSIYFDKKIEFSDLKERLIKSPSIASSTFHKDIKILVELLNYLYAIGDDNMREIASGIFLDKKNAEPSEILVRINSLRRVFGGNKDEFQNFLFPNYMASIDFIPSDGYELILIARKITMDRLKYRDIGRGYIEKLIELV